jgi:hypothetical protein
MMMFLKRARPCTICVFLHAISCLAASFHVVGNDLGAWPRILGSVGFQKESGSDGGILLVREGKAEEAPDWMERVKSGAFLILEGDSPLARELGFHPGPGQVRVSSVEDLRRPGLSIVWESAVDLPIFEIPTDARVFARERWRKAPLLAGLRRGQGAVLWVAVSPGERGYERFPYLVQALADLGLEPPFRSRGLWAFFDSSYRARADLDYLARRWRAAGISALHVAAWHYFEPDETRDRYLRTLVESCHRQGILVYAWLELPHVSERFWNDHPEWREQTALLQDARLDWRRLMNLANRDCFRAAAAGVRGLLDRFDWDGVNLAELYFESLQGHATPSRFTPMNGDVRREFQSRSGFDPLELFKPESARHYSLNESGLRDFLDYRADLARRIQTEWIGEVEALRRSKPDLGLVLTHVDDHFDPSIRETIGADTSALLPLLAHHNFTFLVEDPATVWNLGPDRYPQIALSYAKQTQHTSRLAIDINIVERYQDVYPTKQQTGGELFQLVNTASRTFPRVAVYFENSILPPDIPWLSSAAATVDRFEHNETGLTIQSPRGIGVPWKGPALVDGRPWPAFDGETVWLPPGLHTIGRAEREPHARLLDFTGDLVAAMCLLDGLEFSYRSDATAFAFIDRRPRAVGVDGEVLEIQGIDSEGRHIIRLPRGQHLVTVKTE